jgi:hypothetical protein
MGIKIINYDKTTQMEPRRDQEEDGQTHRPTLHLHQEMPNFAVVNQIGAPIKTHTSGVKR